MFLRDLFHFLPRSPLRRALGAMNRGEFKRSRAARGHVGRPTDDCVVCLRGYIQWGKQCRDAGDLHAALRCSNAVSCATFADIHVLLAQLYEHVDRPRRTPGLRARPRSQPTLFDARLGQHDSWRTRGKRILAPIAGGRQHAPPQARGMNERAGGAHADPARARKLASERRSPPNERRRRRHRRRRAMRTGENGRAIALRRWWRPRRGRPAQPARHRLRQRAMLDDAVEEFERAVALNPDYVEARLNLGLALFHRGRHEEATRQLRWIESRHPGHEIVRKVLEQIEAPRQQALSARA
jgi:tetratricopeptide (TPR) repeat protein